MRLPPYVPVHVHDETGRLVEVRECAVEWAGPGSLAVRIGDLPAGWSAVVAMAVPEADE